jgi:hypothetical protein
MRWLILLFLHSIAIGVMTYLPPETPVLGGAKTSKDDVEATLEGRGPLSKARILPVGEQALLPPPRSYFDLTKVCFRFRAWPCSEINFLMYCQIGTVAACSDVVNP